MPFASFCSVRSPKRKNPSLPARNTPKPRLSRPRDFTRGWWRPGSVHAPPMGDENGNQVEGAGELQPTHNQGEENSGNGQANRDRGKADPPRVVAVVLPPRVGVGS